MSDQDYAVKGIYMPRCVPLILKFSSFVSLLVILSFSSATFAQTAKKGAAKSSDSSGPSLQETLDWIVNAVNSNEPVKYRYRNKPGDDDWTATQSFSAKPVSKTTFEVIDTSLAFTRGFRTKTTYVFVIDGERLDPSAVSVDRKSTTSEGAIYVDGHASYFSVCGITTNKVRAIAVNEVVTSSGQEGKDTVEQREKKWSSFCFDVISESDASRLSKALRHFATLAGGKAASKSAF